MCLHETWGLFLQIFGWIEFSKYFLKKNGLYKEPKSYSVHFLNFFVEFIFYIFCNKSKGVDIKLWTKFKVVRSDFGEIGVSNANWSSNCRRTFARMCSIGNLVMHFPKIAYIPWYLVVGVVEAGPQKLWNNFSMSLNQSIPILSKKYPCTV